MNRQKSTNNQQAHEKMLHIVSHPVNANSNHNETSLHHSRIGCNERDSSKVLRSAEVGLSRIAYRIYSTTDFAQKVKHHI